MAPLQRLSLASGTALFDALRAPACSEVPLPASQPAVSQQPAVFEQPTTPERHSQSWATNTGVIVIAIVAAVAALYLARAFVIPLLLGIFASYTLSPLVDWLKAWRVPRPLAAALVLSVLAGGMSWLGFSLSDGAAEMTENLPRAAQKLRQKLNAASSGSPTALQNMQEAAGELEGAASEAGMKRGSRVTPVQVPEASPWLREYALAQTGLLFASIRRAAAPQLRAPIISRS
jgi:hypothetical protein